VFYELFWFFRDNGLTSKEIEPLILQILNSGRCKVVGDDGKFLKRALELCRSLSPSRFNDMLIVAIAEKYGKLATYDKKLRSKAERAWD
jgi:predicted nucleic acid-binding protein